MKLSNLVNTQINTSHQLNYICGGRICDSQIDQPIESLFVEAAVKSHVLTERELKVLEEAVDSWISRIHKDKPFQNKEEMQELLHFVGGASIEELEQLCAQGLNSKGNLLQNGRWFTSMCHCFNISDQQAIRQIRNSVRQTLKSQRPEPTPPPIQQEPTPEASPEAEEEPTSAEGPADRSTKGGSRRQGRSTKTGDQAQQLRDLRNTVSQHINTTKKLSQFNKQLKQEIHKRQEELLKRLRELRDQQTNTEDNIPVMTACASLILELPSTKSHLRAIVERMLDPEHGFNISEAVMYRRLSSIIYERRSNFKPDPGTIQEADDRQQATNKRIIKMLNGKLVDISKHRISRAIESEGLTPEQFAEIWEEYKRLGNLRGDKGLNRRGEQKFNDRLEIVLKVLQSIKEDNRLTSEARRRDQHARQQIIEHMRKGGLDEQRVQKLESVKGGASEMLDYLRCEGILAENGIRSLSRHLRSA